jgi:cytosine/uracil/thiamine/allantoin permease
MWRCLLILLIVLPPAAIALNHEVISFLLIMGWTIVVIPLCILQAIDFFRNGHSPRHVWVKNILRIPIALFGLLSFLSGLSIIAWCVYNIAVRRLPEYSGPTDTLGLWLSGFGVGPALTSFGWYLLRLSVSRVNKHQEKPFGKEGSSLTDTAD